MTAKEHSKRNKRPGESKPAAKRPAARRYVEPRPLRYETLMAVLVMVVAIVLLYPSHIFQDKIFFSGDTKAAASFAEGLIGIRVGKRFYPMALDDLFFLSLQVPALFSQFNGLTDSKGTMVGSVNIPAIQALAGYPFSIAFVTASPKAPQGIQDISGPWKVTLTK